MFELTERQRQLINAVIEMFMQTATPVGSEELKDTYSFDFSAATIRNELADLAKEGLLSKSTPQLVEFQQLLLGDITLQKF